MLLDITLKITPEMVKEASQNTNKSLVGHMGTHFDVMDKEFPLAYTRLEGVVFDVSAVKDRDIGIADIAVDAVRRDMFVAFYTGYMEEVGYGNKTYFGQHPQLSHALIDALLDRGVSIIGIDCAGIRQGREHVPTDQRCADKGAFVIENLWGLKTVIDNGGSFTAHTYPMNYTGITGLPCRVIAEI